MSDIRTVTLKPAAMLFCAAESCTLGGASGYDIAKASEGGWGTQRIYTVLKLMKNQGYLTFVEAASEYGKRDRKLYTLTHGGRKKFREFIKEKLIDQMREGLEPDDHILLGVKSAYDHSLITKEEFIAVMDAYREFYEARYEAVYLGEGSHFNYLHRKCLAKAEIEFVDKFKQYLV